MRDKNPNKIEVHVAGICFKNNKVMILKRSKKEDLYPGLWECGGGQVNPGENFKEAIKRELKEEAGIFANPLKVLDVYKIEIDEKQKVIPGVKFICKYMRGSLKPGPDVEKCKWVRREEIENFKFIPGVKKDIKYAYQTKTNPW